jgi:hypothetical protein
MGILEIKESLDWSFTNIAIDNKHLENIHTIQWMEKYKQAVRDAGLLEKQIKKIAGTGYVGSSNCKSCHTYEHEQWSQKSHATAFYTLEKDNYHYDPQCVGCHVVGYEYEEGFRTKEETPHLIHVGCESCHGPGIQHILNPQKEYGSTNKDTCLECHQPEHSPNFKYEKFREQIRHWR